MDSVVEITEYRIYSIYIAEKIEWEKKNSLSYLWDSKLIFMSTQPQRERRK